ncbi:hypothetical protein ACHAW5_004332 [Stephanodiscus triporus]|uniref:Uncharacterized protein n=1 Tax=Stephanodiscus triporus TaxID=2934178 RepID=A0ABD3N272_9STRA
MICEGGGGYLMWLDDWTGRRSSSTGKIETSPVQFWQRDSVVHSGFWLGTSKAAREKMAVLESSSCGDEP